MKIVVAYSSFKIFKIYTPEEKMFESETLRN